MAREIDHIWADSLLVGNLPNGCELCARGSKMVLFVTGLCGSSCYYCPLSEEKSGHDVIFADEMPVVKDADILQESDAIGGEGAGISGGDPLCRLDRTLHYIRFLKKTYGSDYHIHLYTSQSGTTKEVLEQLVTAGLDEIRFHPQSKDWSGIEAAIALGIHVGIEVPAVPGQSEELRQMLTRAEALGVGFVNINELEASESNFQRLLQMGMRLTDMESASIEGSAKMAKQIIQWASDNLQSLDVHYCSARFKDSIQMRNRLERRLERTIREFEEREDDDPLVIIGVIRAPHGKTLNEIELHDIYSALRVEFDVPHDMMNIDSTRMRVEIAAWILEEIHEELRDVLALEDELEMGVALEYPSFDRLQTLFDPF